VKAAQPFDPEKPPKRFWGTIFGNNACTRKLLPIYIPGNWLAVSRISGRHSTCFHKSRNSLAGLAVPFGFCSGGFSSTAGYVPGNEALRSRETSERLCYLKVDQFLKARLRFYPLSPK